VVRLLSVCGVGGATLAGYAEADRLGGRILVKVDGDDQMDLSYLGQLIAPILLGEADYAKGNRFTSISHLTAMPPIRVFGNAALHPNQSFNQINLIESGANTNYNGLFVHLQKRLGAGLLFQGSYTWSHAIADNLGESGSISDPTNLRRDFGNADNDLRHYFVGQWLYEPHFKSLSLKWINGFELSSMMFFNSGYPINAVSGVDLNNDGVSNDRPLFRGRNDVAGPGLTQFDARLQRTFTYRERYRLVGLIEAENALNHTNAACSTASGCSGAVVNTATAADFGRITSARTARNLQLGFKVVF